MAQQDDGRFPAARPDARAKANEPIRFGALAEALADMAERLVPDWLPGGKREGDEWVVLSPWRSEKSPSCKVCLRGSKAGLWMDFGGDRKGPDLIALYAELRGLAPVDAAIELAHTHGLEQVANVKKRRPGAGPVQAPAPMPKALPPPAEPSRPREDEGWQVVVPVPAHAPEPTFRHHARRPADLEHKAEYRIDGQLFGYVVRFRTSTGGKDTLPYTFCQSGRDGTLKWHWKTWDEPRPLYLPGGLSPASMGGLGPRDDEPTVVLVEGEKKADTLHQVLQAAAPGVYCVASWAGGCKAWKRADWAPLAGAHVLLWPDCDAQREKLSRAEAEGLDELARAALQQAKPILPEAQQPGHMAMQGIGAVLARQHACTVMRLPIPQPGAVADGWDCGDAITHDGWGVDELLRFFAQAQPLVMDAEPGPDAKPQGGGKKIDGPVADDGGGSGPPGGGGGGGEGDGTGDAFEDYLRAISDDRKDIAVTRKVVVAALRMAPMLQGTVGFDDLHGGPATMRPWPWRAESGRLHDTDDLRLGDWLSREYRLKGASRAALFEAIETVADEVHFHPVRDWLQGLQWDGKPRLGGWLAWVTNTNPAELPPRRRKYLELVSRRFLIAMVARAMEPGCKVDTTLVLEGPGGIGKSSVFATLAGREWYSDTHFDIADGKDGYEQLSGVWLYEFSEITQLRKADSESVKQFFSSPQDRYRAAYGRFVQPHPRQCVIGCSTNKREYLVDQSGNRRYWPWWCGEQALKIEWLASRREQLFAEALAAYRQGERWWVTDEEQHAYFEREQEQRLLEGSVISRLRWLLTREGSQQGDLSAAKEITSLTEFVTMDMLVTALGTDVGRASVQLEGQIRSWLEAQGWRSGREGGGARRRGWKRPAEWPPKQDEEPATRQREPGEDDEPLPDAPGTDGGADVLPF